MHENKFTRHDPSIHGPELRCDAVTAAGPCPYIKVEGANHCPMHMATTLVNRGTEQIRNYRLSQWQSRVGEFSDSNVIKSLGEEIGVMRLLVESVVSSCRTQTDLILHSGRIAGLIAHLEKLVVSFDRLETKMGLMLNKTAILQFAGSVVEIIGKHIDNPEMLEAISNEIAQAVANTSGEIKE